jgi:hypothetical protein
MDLFKGVIKLEGGEAKIDALKNGRIVDSLKLLKGDSSLGSVFDLGKMNVDRDNNRSKVIFGVSTKIRLMIFKNSIEQRKVVELDPSSSQETLENTIHKFLMTVLNKRVELVNDIDLFMEATELKIKYSFFCHPRMKYLLFIRNTLLNASDPLSLKRKKLINFKKEIGKFGLAILSNLAKIESAFYLQSEKSKSITEYLLFPLDPEICNDMSVETSKLTMVENRVASKFHGEFTSKSLMSFFNREDLFNLQELNQETLDVAKDKHMSIVFYADMEGLEARASDLTRKLDTFDIRIFDIFTGFSKLFYQKNDETNLIFAKLNKFEDPDGVFQQFNLNQAYHHYKSQKMLEFDYKDKFMIGVLRNVNGKFETHFLTCSSNSITNYDELNLFLTIIFSGDQLPYRYQHDLSQSEPNYSQIKKLSSRSFNKHILSKDFHKVLFVYKGISMQIVILLKYLNNLAYNFSQTEDTGKTKFI